MQKGAFLARVNDAARTILKRDLSDSEVREYVEMADSIGYDVMKEMAFLYLINQRSNHNIELRTEELTTTAAKAVDTIKDALSDVTNEGRNIVEEHKKFRDAIDEQFKETVAKACEDTLKNMTDIVQERAEELFNKEREFFSLRVNINLVIVMGFVAALSYTLGVGGVNLDRGGIMAFTQIRAGWFMLFSAIACTATWLYDRRLDIRRDKKLWAALAGMLLAILILILAMI